nr:GMC family oxidoreductase N-terminal domain-containing protein [Sulfitobacter sp. W027]
MTSGATLAARDGGWNDVLPIFKDLECNTIGQSTDFHGSNGERHVSNPTDPNPVCDQFIRAGETLQLPHNMDFNGPSQLGLGIYNVTKKTDCASRPTMLFSNPSYTGRIWKCGQEPN